MDSTTLRSLLLIALLAGFSAMRVEGAGQSSASFHIQADVTTRGSSPLAIGSAGAQASVSVAQSAVTGPKLVGTGIELFPGFQTAIEGFDSDYDGVLDNEDEDDDEDGVADGVDARPFDTDGDGLNNLNDEDDDGEGLIDTLESEFGTSWILPDTDFDTQTDYEEWVAGTSGTDGGDFFAIKVAEGVTPDGVRVQWDGVSGRSYQVLITNRLAGVEGGWTAVWTTNVVTSQPVTYKGPASADAEFYRLTVSRE